jgi:hypothetical protein
MPVLNEDGVPVRGLADGGYFVTLDPEKSGQRLLPSATVAAGLAPAATAVQDDDLGTFARRTTVGFLTRAVAEADFAAIAARITALEAQMP